ncbi:type II secretion system protein [Amedibacillus sp. YH-ame6]
MKNNKGMTLMETLMAIFILSIAGLMIMTGIISVIRVMGDANTIKDQSDLLLSKAEKTDKDVSKNVKIKDTEFTFSIKNNFGTSFSKQLSFAEYSMTKDSEISLKAIANPSLKPVSSDVVTNANLFNLYVKKFENNFIPRPSDISSYNLVFDQTRYEDFNLGRFDNGRYIVYPNEIFPLAIQSLNTTYYLKAYYPWEYSRNAQHNGILIYLSKYPDYVSAAKNESNGPKENIHFIYNYESNSWFYFAGNDYQINYATDFNYVYNTSALSFKNDTSQIRSWSQLKLHLNSTKGWKELDMNVNLDPNKPDDVWK